MSTPKTVKNSSSPAAYLNNIADEDRRRDCKAIDRMLRTVTGDKPAMWGTSIVGYGTKTITYANGKTSDWMALGFSNRKQAITLYIGDFPERDELLSKLGPYKTGKSCLYIKRLADIDEDVLMQLLAASYASAKA